MGVVVEQQPMLPAGLPTGAIVALAILATAIWMAAHWLKPRTASLPARGLALAVRLVLGTSAIWLAVQASARVLQPLMSAERLAQDLPTELIETHVQGQVTVQDSPEALINVLSILEETGVGAALFGTRQIVAVVDAEDESVDPDSATPETASLPAGTP